MEQPSHRLETADFSLPDPVLDPEVNRKVLIDHIYLVTTGEITKAARKLLVEKLDTDQQRTIIFWDLAELLNVLVLASLALPAPAEPDFSF